LEGVGTPAVADGAEHVYHQYTVRVPAGERDRFAAALKEEYNIGSGVYYPIPNHRLPSFNLDADLPHTEQASREVLSLPVHPSLDPEDLDRIVTAVNALAKAGA
ncbi:MAG TPA: DegT/DnrJ/EryC1/StrS family aminotransferase, partial [Arthrobacter sp.]|nr:DegT/DnrJ/EryC1/StrS family aminotransferase [Arthrobacter sp.]